MPHRIRKQVYELGASDFEEHACWEYASDEEGREDQDECTVRPFPLAELGGATHQAFVQAAFFFPNGSVRLGMVTLNAGNDPSGHQPALFTSKGLLGFYEGATQPKPSAVKRFIASLKKISPVPLPVRYVSALCAGSGQPLAAGTLEGLYWLVNWQTGELCAEA
ncbi:hypothetical protein [Ideonella sp. BN130291]|uniref:hypothetical protein n=1 Tax=Ideonella sp. BN130291 TaxID=3112940 RepID=UPI002E261F87|nr:hypothetical protein [Ideonella sp. BN130291]